MKWLIRVLKIVWIVAMVAAFAWYLSTHWDDFRAYAGEIGVSAILVSIGFLLAGKVLLAQISLESLRMFAFRLSFWKAFLIYSLSQLGKYVPGGVLQYVGRVLLYKAEGLPAKKGAKLLLVESFWLLGSAGAVGVATCAGRLTELSGLPIEPSFGLSAGLAAAALGLWLVLLWAGTRAFSDRFADRRVSEVKVYVLEFLAWILLGVSFWALFPADIRTAETLGVAIGAFALGWAGGYVIHIAPAGLGIREAIIVALVADLMPLPEAIAAVSFSRLVWTGTEVLLGAIAASQFRTGGGDKFGTVLAGNDAVA